MSGTTRPRPRLAAATAATAAAAALALSGCSSSGSSGSGDGQIGFVTAKGTNLSTAAAGHRQDAPDISGGTLEGTPVKLSDYRGKVVVLNVWGSWCGPCRAEADDLQRTWEKYKDQGVQFLGINTRDPEIKNAVRFEQEKGVTYPSLYDPAGTQLLKFPKGSLNLQTLPTTLVVDRDGKLAARAVGGQTDDALESILQPVLAEQKQ
ncbi:MULTISPECIES: TlpA disulfide reductase family protein [unclassified Kitasatospora]|uniref:TlpA family protein disulfide reductase n=1 Tax=unclassified Kitasatospora TaxID=2633591 RepID=UPI001AE0DD69|nr:TlpA disulfide reductase family protein [Kitasatospora sp. RG8]MBP0455282.1 TlpA family protein disulfide reductase [Kitasatospora sp. RG8]